jgi:hypothetical protein
MPILPLIAAFALGSATKKTPKRQAVSKYKKKNGTKVKGYTRKRKSKSTFI